MALYSNKLCSNCRLCQVATEICVPGDGDLDAKVMVIYDAHHNRDLIDRDIAPRLKAKSVFYTPAVLCEFLPGTNITKTHIRDCGDYIHKHIQAIDPDFILLVGNQALESVTGAPGIKSRRGKPFEQDGRICMAVWSPGYVYTFPEQEATLDRDMEVFNKIVKSGQIPQEKNLNLRLVLTWEDFDEMIADFGRVISCDLETTGLYPWEAGSGVVSIGFGTANHQWVIPTNHFHASPWRGRDIEKMVEILDDEIATRKVVYHGGKFDILWMRVHYRVTWDIYFDTMLAHYALDENSRHGLKELATRVYNAPDWDIDKEEKKGATTLKKLSIYHGHDLYYTRKLFFYLSKRLRKEPRVKAVFDHILMPINHCYADIEYHGVEVNQEGFNAAEDYLVGEIAKREAELNKWKKIKWSSPQQVATYLYDELDIIPPMLTKSGNYSTSESALNMIDHPIILPLLQYRAARQQYNFFIKGWKPYLVHGRLHPHFKIHGTVTGRPSCENPNLQQVPRESLIRSLITAKKGYVLIEADLSQIELRIAAELAGERNMLQAFAEDRDVHWITAIREISRANAQKELVISTAKKITGKKLLYNEAIDEILIAGAAVCEIMDPQWKEYRKKAKAINFGYLYGMWWKKFKMYARDNYGVEVTDEEAEASRNAFFELYADFVEWHKKQKRFARRYGYVESLTGRKRRLPDAQLRDGSWEQKAAERQAINSPVQSSASDFNLMAVIEFSQRWPSRIARVVGTIHDAILIEVKKEFVEAAYNDILSIMSKPKLMETLEIAIRVPIHAEAKIGPWSKGISLEKWKEKHAHIRNKPIPVKELA